MLLHLALTALAATSPADPSIVLESLDGSRRRMAADDLGKLTDPRETFSAHILRFEGFERPLAFADWETREDLAMLELSGGDRLRARIVGGNEEALAATLVGDVPLKLSIEDLRSIRFEERLRANTGGLRVEAVAEGDVLFRVVQDGLDRIEGTVLNFSSSAVTFEVAQIGDSKTYPWSEVAAIFIEDLGGAEGDAAAGLPVALDLIDLGRVTAQLESVHEGRVSLQLAGGTALALPLWAVDQLSVQDGRLAYLSDYAPDQAEEGSPFGDDLGMVWSHRMDRSVTGLPLTANRQLYTRGIGVHSPSRLTWDLTRLGEGNWQSLRGLVSIDDEVLHLGSKGSVQFLVEADGEVLWQSPVVRGGDPPLALPAIDLSSRSQLSLVVDMATDLHVADRADWLQVRLTR